MRLSVNHCTSFQCQGMLVPSHPQGRISLSFLWDIQFTRKEDDNFLTDEGRSLRDLSFSCCSGARQGVDLKLSLFTINIFIMASLSHPLLGQVLKSEISLIPFLENRLLISCKCGGWIAIQLFKVELETWGSNFSIYILPNVLSVYNALFFMIHADLISEQFEDSSE